MSPVGAIGPEIRNLNVYCMSHHEPLNQSLPNRRVGMNYENPMDDHRIDVSATRLG
ncbi:MAG: hypothetical protein ACI9B8_001631 [Sulfitobacter sp.]|jgi:hypothetical protein